HTMPPPTSVSSTLSLHDALPIYSVCGDSRTQLPEHPLSDRELNRRRLPSEAVLLPRVAGLASRDDVTFGGPPAANERDDVVHGEDRKSTRLNSSHDQISYAVFCL